MARLDHRTDEDHRSADQSRGAWRQRIRCVPSGDPVDAGLRFFEQADDHRMGLHSHGSRLARLQVRLYLAHVCKFVFRQPSCLQPEGSFHPVNREVDKGNQRSEGTRICYKDWGTGQPLFFHHGWLSRVTISEHPSVDMLVAQLAVVVTPPRMNQPSTRADRQVLVDRRIMSTLPPTFSYWFQFRPYPYLATSYDGYILSFVIFGDSVRSLKLLSFPSPLTSEGTKIQAVNC